MENPNIKPILALSDDEALLEAIGMILVSFPVTFCRRSSQLLASMLNQQPDIVILDALFAQRVAALLSESNMTDTIMVFINADESPKGSERSSALNRAFYLPKGKLNDLSKVVRHILIEGFEIEPITIQEQSKKIQLPGWLSMESQTALEDLYLDGEILSPHRHQA